MANRWRCSQLIYIDVTGQYNPKIVLLFFSDELFRLDLKKLADWLFGSISIINFVRNTAELFSSVYEQFVPNIKWHFTWCRIERLSSAQYIYIWPATLTSIHTHHRTRNRQLVCSTHAAAGMGGTRVTVLVQPVVNVFLYNCQTVVSMCICRRCHVILLTVQCIYYNSGPVCQVTKSSRTIKNDTQIIIHATACLPTKEKKKKTNFNSIRIGNVDTKQVAVDLVLVLLLLLLVCDIVSVYFVLCFFVCFVLYSLSPSQPSYIHIPIVISLLV